MSSPEISHNDEALLTTVAAAAYLGLSKAWLDRDRTRAVSRIPYVRVGERAVRYRLLDLKTYIDRHTMGG